MILKRVALVIFCKYMNKIADYQIKGDEVDAYSEKM